MKTKVIRVHYDVDTDYVDVRVPADLDPDEYDEWFDVINSRVDVTHSYAVQRAFREGDATDWDLTE
jgi:hypothetical protein